MTESRLKKFADQVGSRTFEQLPRPRPTLATTAEANTNISIAANSNDGEADTIKAESQQLQRNSNAYQPSYRRIVAAIHSTVLTTEENNERE